MICCVADSTAHPIKIENLCFVYFCLLDRDAPKVTLPIYFYGNYQTLSKDDNPVGWNIFSPSKSNTFPNRLWCLFTSTLEKKWKTLTRARNEVKRKERNLLKYVQLHTPLRTWLVAIASTDTNYSPLNCAHIYCLVSTIVDKY